MTWTKIRNPPKNREEQKIDEKQTSAIEVGLKKLKAKPRKLYIIRV